MSLPRKILRSIRKFKLLNRGDRLLVAVSGGPDSVGLLDGLCHLRDELGLHLEVAHLQHGIRGGEAKADARFVADLAEKRELAFHLKEVDLPRMRSTTGKGNLEALARTERYGFLAEVVRRHQLDKVATAHTLDDQAETMLMWFLRGAGLKGLGGMAPLQRLDLAGTGSGKPLLVVRPLLETSKADVMQYLADKRLFYRLDRTNEDPIFLRNWVRTELLPKIQSRFDARVPNRLGQLAALLRDEEDYIESEARRDLAALLEKHCLPRSGLLARPKALQRRILRLWVEQTGGRPQGLEFVHIEEMLRLIGEGPPQGRVSIPDGWELKREYERLRLTRHSRNQPPRAYYSYPVEVGSLLAIPEARMEIHSRSAVPIQWPKDLMEAVFDLDALRGKLMMRSFRPGDRFRPLGMSGRKKIKELFIEKRVPLAVRSFWPILVCDGEVLWIPGYGRSESAQVGPKTTAIVELKARPIPS